MKKLKKKTKIFFKSFYLSLTIFVCFFIALAGACKAYEGIRHIGFGEYRNAIEYKDGTFKFFDFEFEIKKS